MILRLFALMLLVGFLATVGGGNGEDDNIGQVVLVDGPGGYLPNASSMTGDMNSNMLFDNSNIAFDSSTVFPIEPQINFNNFMPLETEFNFGNIWDSNWNSLFNTKSYLFYL